MRGAERSTDRPNTATTKGDRASSRVFLPTVAVLLVVAVVGLVGLSPLALGAVRGIDDDWESLSFIGQTYGAASALLAGLALAGVVATLVLQARETRMSRELALRDSNSELLRIAMESPEYAECWGANLPLPEGKAQRQSMYTNMILSQWEMAYESRAIGDAHLRALARNLFVGRVGWNFWNRVRSIRLSTAETRRSRRFHRIVDDEFQQATEPPPEESEDEPQRRRPRRWLPVVGALGAGAIASGVAIVRHRRSLSAPPAPAAGTVTRPGRGRRRGTRPIRGR
ncbi:hypothetical protein F4561_004007 [Lipingzhangella halophila]|uniref:Uncharacterized protein n=1 Tax=Lipingzhangella halophila TaxID=1783352 RepID=A0A7W7RJT0_9ACTN|nr:DUF6082 family protein [Lipingzhangella halophila]MBB4933187.1 hypothetical protein [Lipingzhangella halophila]